MSRSVSIDAMNKISYCLTYHSFLFYISKLLFVTVILYFCIHFHLAPVEGLFFKPKYRANILCICFNFIAVSFPFLSSPWGSVYRFCTRYCKPSVTLMKHIRLDSIAFFAASLEISHTFPHCSGKVCFIVNGYFVAFRHLKEEAI